MKKLLLLLLLIFLSSCVSPAVTVNKNVTITLTDVPGQVCSALVRGVYPIWINVEYTTKSELDTDLKVDQDIKPETTIPFPGL